jgi:hypothetical protein
MNTDTPLPQEEPAGENPPDGAIIDYYLKNNSNSPVTLDILDATGKVVRHYASTDTLYAVPDVNIPTYWIRPQQTLSATAGAHRFIWDLHYQPLNIPASYPISAVYANTAPSATSPWAAPGTYTVKLSANGMVYTQPLTIRMDPRVKTAPAALALQQSLAMEAYIGRRLAMNGVEKMRRLRAHIATAEAGATGDRLTALQQLDARAAALEGIARRGRGGAAPAENGPRSYSQLQNDYATLFGILEEADMEPTTQVQAAMQETGVASRATGAALSKLEKEAMALNIVL